MPVFIVSGSYYRMDRRVMRRMTKEEKIWLEDFEREANPSDHRNDTQWGRDRRTAHERDMASCWRRVSMMNPESPDDELAYTHRPLAGMRYPVEHETPIDPLEIERKRWAYTVFDWQYTLTNGVEDRIIGVIDSQRPKRLNPKPGLIRIAENHWQASRFWNGKLYREHFDNLEDADQWLVSLNKKISTLAV